jgi:hypothetical protein
VTRELGGGLKQLLDDLKEDRVLEISRGSTRWHSVENFIWTSLQNERAEDGVISGLMHPSILPYLSGFQKDSKCYFFLPNTYYVSTGHSTGKSPCVFFAFRLRNVSKCVYVYTNP